MNAAKSGLAHVLLSNPLREGQALNLGENIGLHVLNRQRVGRAVKDLQQARRAGGAYAVGSRSPVDGGGRK